MTESEQQVRSYVQRFERLMEQQQEAADDIAALAREAKSAGYDVSLLKRLATLRLKDKVKAEAEKLALLRTYADAAQIDLFNDYAPTCRQVAE